ncbi:MAG: hypothetical protein EOO67_11185, partial [Microbacterium sp.]
MRENTGRRSVTFTGAAAIATLFLGVGAPATQVEAHTTDHAVTQQVAPSATVAGPARVITAGSRVTTRWSKSIDTSSQSAVNAAYRSAYAPRLTQVIDWIGRQPSTLPP